MKTLREIRLESGKTLEDMANIIGVTTPAYYNYENGIRKIPADRAVRLANYLGVKVGDIFLPSSFSVR